MGVFAQMSQGLLELRGWDLVFVQTPPDTPRVPGEQVQGFIVYQRNLGDLASYRLWVVGTNTPISIIVEPTQERKMVLVRPAASLPKGSYVLEIPKDSMFGGRNWYYFVVE